MRLNGYINNPAEPEFLALIHGMIYLIHQPHETITYSRKNIFNLEEIQNQLFSKAGSAKINKTQAN